MTGASPVGTRGRQKALENVILPHARFKEALAALGRVGDRASDGEDGLAGRARVVIGGSGAGKTQLLRSLEREGWATPSRDDSGAVRQPLLFVEVPERVTPRQLVVETMKALGEPAPTKGETKEDILAEFAVVSRAIGLRVLLLDEAHWLMKSKSAAVREANAEFVKSMLNRTGVHMVLAGMEDLAKLHSHDVAQTRRRMLTKVHLRPYNWSIPTERAAFQTILKLYEKAIGYPKPSGIGDTDLSRRLSLVSGGELGVVVQYLSNAIELVDATGGRSIGRDVLARVHDDLSDQLEEQVVGGMDEFVEAPSRSQRNPFGCDPSALGKLWTARFGVVKDLSRQTKLAPGPRPGA